MCVLAIAWNATPDWRLVVAGNRDERHDRASAPAARWAEDGAVIAGRDLVAGGTWMGVSEAGRFVVVTNFAGELPDPAAPSRGMLVSDLLQGGEAGASLAAYNPMSLISIDGTSARFAANRPTLIDRPLEAGIHGLSNSALDDRWPRTTALVDRLATWLSGPTDPANLLRDLADDRRFGSGDVLDPMSRPIFIRHPSYGTRCSTVIAIDAAGHGRFIERRFDPAGSVTGETGLDFRWPAGD